MISARIRQAIHGSAWTLAGYGSGQVLRLVAQLLLARRLAPSAFGLAALVTVFLSGLDMFSDLGVELDVVQHRRGDDPAFINTAVLIQMLRGALLCGVAVALAKPFALFYRQPQVQWLAIVAALSIGIRGCASGSVWIMMRQVKLRKLTVLNLTGDAVGLVVSLVWMSVSPTAWALVMGRVASSATYAVGSHLVAERPLTLQWDSAAARDILAFGSGVFLSSATYFLSGEAERLIVGKFITVTELGCISLALSLSAAPAQALSRVVGQVFFPMISSSIREDRNLAANHYKKARIAFLLISIVLGVGFVAYSPRLVALLLPAKYAMTGWMLQWLGFRAAQQVFSAPTTGLILACGDSRYLAIANTARFILMVSGIWLAFHYFGIHVAIAVLALVPAVTYLIPLIGVAHHLRRALWTEITAVSVFTAAMLLAAVIHWPWA